MNKRRRLWFLPFFTGFLVLGVAVPAGAGQPLVLTLSLSEAVETALLNNLGLHLKQQDVV